MEDLFLNSFNPTILINDAQAILELTKISDNIAGDYIEAESTSKKDESNLFRPAGDEKYIFNLGTKHLELITYELKITADDGQVFTVQISLR